MATCWKESRSLSDTSGDQPEHTPPGAISSREALIALQHVYNETEALYCQSNIFFEQIYGTGDVSMNLRDVLLTLLRQGPQTVPQMARTRMVSRQYMQKLVNQLIEDGYVSLIENIAHKRSHMVHLNQKGTDYIRAMRQREMQIVVQLVINFPVEKLQETAEMLRHIREWQKDELGRILQQNNQQNDQ